MKRLIMILFLLFPVMIFSQNTATDGKTDFTAFPVQSVRNDSFNLINLSFNEFVSDIRGKTLEVEFQLESKLDYSRQYYIFIIATYEKSYKTKSSFESPSLDDPDEIKLLVPFPDDMSNFEYNDRDEKGTEKKVYAKYPKNIKSGVDPITGQPYVLDDRLTFRSRHLSKYRKNFVYFNQVCILIFDADEELVFRQVYEVRAKR
ncbi:MAG TPA: hypothetical protein PK986_01350 [Spirochaetota bacterium]|nr:hypothetical protein [Spirochaetota bacterium]HQO39090.1 hypothetical protein [Spirochaetota bacterium]